MPSRPPRTPPAYPTDLMGPSDEPFELELCGYEKRSHQSVQDFLLWQKRLYERSKRPKPLPLERPEGSIRRIEPKPASTLWKYFLLDLVLTVLTVEIHMLIR